jgi:hypothetical protein
VSRHGDFFRNFTSNKVKSAIQKIKSIMKLEDDQISMRLLENTSGTNTVNHLYRTIHPSYFGSTTETLRNELKSSLRTCLTGNSPGFGEFAYTMASLPNSKGGFGISDPRVLEQYVYIAMFITTKDEQSKLFPQLSVDFPSEVDQLINKYVENFPPAEHESIKELTILPHSKKQKQLAMLLTSEIRSLTIREWKLKNTADPYFNEKLLVLESAAVPFTSLWQHVLPNKGLKQTMSNSEFHTTCKLQLLMPIMQGGTCVECGKDADQFGYHIVTCLGTCI